MKESQLFCTKCGKEYRINKDCFRCNYCDEPLEIKEVCSGRIRTELGVYASIFERYADFFPFDRPFPQIELGEGRTPLLSSTPQAEKNDLKKVFLKNETMNPTWSFKDRGTASAMRHAIELGFKKVGTLSSGNMAASVAAYGARANLDVFILVGESTPQEKVNPVSMYGVNVIKVRGDYGEVYSASLKLGKELGIYFMNSDAPFRIEGSKTLAFEISEQTSFDVPDYVIVPTSSGGNLRGIEKGFREFYACGFIDKVPLIVAAQDMGVCPIHLAFISGKDVVSHWDNPKYIDNAISNPNPPSGNRVLEVLRKNGGLTVAVSQEKIIRAQAELASEGIFVQPGSAVSVAAIECLREQGILNSSDCVLSILTGSGLKYTEAFRHHHLKFHDVKLSEIETYIKNILS